MSWLTKQVKNCALNLNGSFLPDQFFFLNTAYITLVGFVLNLKSAFFYPYHHRGKVPTLPPLNHLCVRTRIEGGVFGYKKKKNDVGESQSQN